jgi:hypothetical protein
MSKFLNEVKYRMTGERRYDTLVPLEIKVETRDTTESYLRGPDMIEVEVGVRAVQKMFCKRDEISEALVMVTRQLQHDIYDDFAGLVLEMETAMYNRDVTAMKAVLHKMRAEMGIA